MSETKDTPWEDVSHKRKTLSGAYAITEIKNAHGEIVDLSDPGLIGRIVAAVNAQAEQQSTPPTEPTLSPLALAEGRRLMEAATDAPWNAYDNHVELDGRTVEFFSDNPMEGDSSNDTHLIAWMRNHLPALLSAAERMSQMEGEKVKLQSKINSATQEWQHAADHFARMEKLR